MTRSKLELTSFPFGQINNSESTGLKNDEFQDCVLLTRNMPVFCHVNHVNEMIQ